MVVERHVLQSLFEISGLDQAEGTHTFSAASETARAAQTWLCKGGTRHDYIHFDKYSLLRSLQILPSVRQNTKSSQSTLSLPRLLAVVHIAEVHMALNSEPAEPSCGPVISSRATANSIISAYLKERSPCYRRLSELRHQASIPLPPDGRKLTCDQSGLAEP